MINRKKHPPKGQQTVADKAFTGSDKHTLDDLKLEPWTPDRQIIFQTLSGIYPNLGKAGWQQFTQTNVYPGATRDVMLFVYLSTLPPEDLIDQKTGDVIQIGVESATWKDAKAFGVKRGLHNPDSKAFWQAFAKFMEVQKEITTSLTVPKSDGGAPPDDDDESGND